MKKKLLLTLVMIAMLVCALAIAINADGASVHNGKVDLNAKVALDDGTELNLFDSDGDALIWYRASNGELTSIKAQDERVKYYGTYAFSVGDSKTVGSVTAYEVSKIEIVLESETVNCNKIVVFNIMDDDVMTNAGSRLNCSVNCIRSKTFSDSTELVYAYLRLDTVAIQAEAFVRCKNLKYVNLESLTELRQISGGSAFNGCTSLFVDQIVDLSSTKMCVIGGSGAFNNVKLKGLILPNTVTDLGDWNLQGTGITEFTVPTGVKSLNNSLFNDSKSLKTIYINNTLEKINNRVFNNTALEKVFYCGTLEQVTAFLNASSTESNKPFWDVVGENRANVISYSDYKALEDKSGKYLVYGYSYCEAYKNGIHEEDNNPCVINCTVCNMIGEPEKNPEHNEIYSISYTDYAKNGTKTTTCTNEGCKHLVKEATESIFTFKGYSTDGKELCVGYFINVKAINEFTSNNKDVTLSYGFIAAANNSNPYGVTENTVQVDLTKDSYTGFDFKLTGDWSKEVNKNALLSMNLYTVTTNDDGAVVRYIHGYEDANGNILSQSYELADQITYVQLTNK